NMNSDKLLMNLILDFLNTPQYLRKSIYPLNHELSYIGLLPPIRAPQHKKKVKLSEVKAGELRIGILYHKKSFLNQISNNKRFIIDWRNKTYEYYVDVGLDSPIPFLGQGKDGQKIIVKFIDSYPNLKAIQTTETDIEKEYLGYDILSINSIDEFLKKIDQKTFVVFTSKKGMLFKNKESEFKEIIKKFEILLIVFGSPSKGINEIYPTFQKINNSMYLNMFPHQKTETIRLEEALLGTLTIFNHFLN
ncbi:MAG TPA: putative RNA uridine N3 methyltransferase, partial [Nitrososphaeraceae archaeon]|nr:putative RNA uridine N3 methyltransferase [Nitrososphaeraceae archaeon]